jgi:hypothetical protein
MNTMHTELQATARGARGRRIRYVANRSLAQANMDEWRGRALREHALVRRASRGVQEGSAALAAGPTIDALERDSIGTLLITARFIELHPHLWARACQLTATHRARVIKVTGAAAFELDFMAGGIGAILRRSTALRSAHVQ